ncbi:MAG TPA: hypothetical protein VL328_04375 [Gemmatimonadaceae bacterium]|jgi:hypothetical protein|nr:hypothetical protein [Gemmatimonadaceae bacterium]
MSDETAVDHGTDGAGREDASLGRVETLMAERRKYEGWLEALEARRASTPERVFTRVHGDYHDRLDAVIQQLKEHTEGLRAELTSLTARLTSIDAEQQQRRDERAEAELRAHVGELSEDAWRDIASEADASISALSARHAELERERARTRELLNEAERPPTPRGAPAVATSAAPAPAQASVSRQEPAAGTVEQVGVAERAEADVTPRPTQRADEGRRSGETAGTFDELAFLSSVVNTPAGKPDVPAPTDRPDERARRDSFAQRAPNEDVVNLADPNASLGGAAGGARSAAGSPLAMNVSGNIPIVIKDKSTEAAKSLKCGECGAMNYPTEWYCERCGAELASL